MKRFNRLFIIFGIGALVAWSVQAKAETAVTATHQVVSMQESEEGFLVSLGLTIENTSLDLLSDVTLEIIDPMVITLPGAATLSLSYLPQGSIQVDWDIITLEPLIEAGLPLSIIGKGTDTNGNSVEFLVISEGVSQ